MSAECLILFNYLNKTAWKLAKLVWTLKKNWFGLQKIWFDGHKTDLDLKKIWPGCQI